MKRTLATIILLTVVGASCGSSEPELSDAEAAWCNSHEDPVGGAGLELDVAGQPGLTPEFTPDDYAFRSGPFYWTDESGYAQACRAAYEDR